MPCILAIIGYFIGGLPLAFIGFCAGIAIMGPPRDS